MGRTLSHCKVLEKIGEGGLAEVCLAKLRAEREGEVSWTTTSESMSG
jgi:hypothetical protein